MMNDDGKKPFALKGLSVLLTVALIAPALLCSCSANAPESGALGQPRETDALQSQVNDESALSLEGVLQAAQEAAAPYGDAVAIVVAPLNSAEIAAVNGSQVFTAASMIKLLILAELFYEVDQGNIDLNETYTLQYSDMVGGSGRLQQMGVGSEFTYDELAYYMIAFSDNVATNILIDRLGFDAINQRAADLGLEGTSLNRKMMDLNAGVENYITANDATFLLRGFAQGTLVSSDLCDRAESYLLAQDDNLGLFDGLPESVPFGHKTGSLTTIRHDGGIVYGPNPYVIVVLCDIGAASANQLMGDLSALVFAQMK